MARAFIPIFWKYWVNDFETGENKSFKFLNFVKVQGFQVEKGISLILCILDFIHHLFSNSWNKGGFNSHS